MREFYPIFEQCPLFYGISMPDLQAMMGCIGGHVLAIRKGQHVLHEGQPATHIGMVLQGSVQLVRVDYYGNRSIVAHVGPAQLFGETYACANVPALPISVVADTDSQVLLMDCRRITTSCSNACSFHNQIIFNLLGLVAQKNLMYDHKIQVTSQRTTREKLMTYLLNQAKLQGTSHFTIPYDRQSLADYLEVDRSGLSAEISKLRKEGVLQSKKNQFTLL